MKYLFDTCSIIIVVKRRLGEDLNKYFRNVFVSEFVRKEFENVPDDWTYFTGCFNVTVLDIADMNMLAEMNGLMKASSGISQTDASLVVLAKRNKYTLLITEERLLRSISSHSGFKAKRLVELLFDLKIEYAIIKSLYYDEIKKISSLPREDEKILFNR